MAALTNTQISVTYVGLLKTSASTVLSSTAQQITDGSGNNSILYLSTAGVGIGGAAASGKELDVTGNVLITGDLVVDNITIDGSTITNASGNLTIVNTVDDGDVIFQSDDGSGGVATYFTLDGSQAITTVQKNIRFEDNIELSLGASDDLKLLHNGTDGKIINSTGDLYIEQNTNDADIFIKSDDGSGGITPYITIAGSAETTVISKKFRFEDNVKLTIGTGEDLEIYHDANHSYITDNGTGNLKITASQIDILGTSETLATFIDDGAVELYYDNSKKFETTSAGVSVTGDGLISGDLGIGSTGIFASAVSLNIDGTGLAIKNNVSGSSNNWSIIKNTATSSESNIVFVTGAGTSLTLNHDVSATFAGSATIETGINLESGVLVIKNGTSDSSGLRIFQDSSDASKIYNNFNGTLQLGVGNTTAITIDSSENTTFAGNVTLNGDGKAYKLNTTSYDDWQISVDSNGFIIYNETDSRYDLKIAGDGNATFAGTVDITGAGNTLHLNAASGVTYQKFSENGTSRFFLATLNGSDGLAFVDADGSAERMRINSSGDVGIGMTPTVILDVKSTGSNQDEIALTHSGNTVKIASLGQNSGHGSLTLRANDGTVKAFLNAAGDNSYINSGGLAIGATSLTDTNALHLVSALDNDFPTLKIETTSTTRDASMSFITNGGNTFCIGVDASDSDKFKISDNASLGTNDRLTIDSSGNLGVGTDAPDNILTLQAAAGSMHQRFKEASTTIGFIGGANGIISSHNGKLAIRAESGLVLSSQGNAADVVISSGDATFGGDLTITGALSKGSGSFKIEHPVKPDTHYLYHSFVESPLTDLIYRGKAKLVDGKALINIDKHFGMTEGTFEALVDDKQAFTTNEDSWDAVRGKVEGNELNIECQNKDFNGYVSWLVIGDRKDKHIMEVDWTDERGKPKLEIKK